MKRFYLIALLILFAGCIHAQPGVLKTRKLQADTAKAGLVEGDSGKFTSRLLLGAPISPLGSYSGVYFDILSGKQVSGGDFSGNGGSFGFHAGNSITGASSLFLVAARNVRFVDPLQASSGYQFNIDSTHDLLSFNSLATTSRQYYLQDKSDTVAMLSDILRGNGTVFIFTPPLRGTKAAGLSNNPDTITVRDTATATAGFDTSANYTLTGDWKWQGYDPNATNGKLYSTETIPDTTNDPINTVIEMYVPGGHSGTITGLSSSVYGGSGGSDQRYAITGIAYGGDKNYAGDFSAYFGNENYAVRGDAGVSAAGSSSPSVGVTGLGWTYGVYGSASQASAYGVYSNGKFGVNGSGYLTGGLHADSLYGDGRNITGIRNSDSSRASHISDSTKAVPADTNTFYLTATTRAGTAVEMLIGGTTQLLIPASQSWYYSISVVSSDSSNGNDFKFWTTQGMIQNQAGSVANQDPTGTTGVTPGGSFNSTGGTKNVSIGSDSGTKALKISVTGITATTIFWKARVAITRLSW